MSDPFTHVHQRYMEINKWTKLDSSIIAGFTTRLAGNSINYYQSLNMGLHVNDDPADVINNRELLASEICIPLNDWVCGEQVHDSVIRKVTSEDKGSGVKDMESALSGIDGIYTNEKGILLTAFFADCVPIFYFAPKHHLVGIVHAGWKGSVEEIAPKMIKHWVDKEQVDPKDIHVTIGPSICMNCYEVDQRIIDKVDQLNLSVLPYNKVNDLSFKLNLKQLNMQLLLMSGVIQQHIQVTEYCTSCQSDLFYSHRKEKGKTGRMLGFIGRKE
jgi:polyphenol oxidase